MIAHKHITKIVSVIMVLSVCLCLCAAAFSEKIKTVAGSSGIGQEYESELFSSESPIEVNIIMDSSDWSDMLDNAISEEYKECTVEINGTTFYRVGIRPKGNTSLSSIASDPTTDRYSFKLEFDKYIDGQTCFGLDKLVLNNNYADTTNMKEALIYDMFKSVGADASLCNYAKISVNGEYWGIYLALEAVEDSFLLRNYGVQNGKLYKPESIGIGGGQGGQNKKENENMTPPEAGNETGTTESQNENSSKSSESVSVLSISKSSEESTETSSAIAQNSEPEAKPEPNGGFSMGGNGADLNYTDDELDSYSTIWDGKINGAKKSDKKRVVTALKNISEGTDLENYMDIDNLVKYMAVHVFSVNDDSLSGTMAHNYYLYEYNGKLNLIPWDYNLAFGGMGGKGNATSVVNDAIDNAFSATNFFDTLTANDEYNAMYYENLKKVVEYINGGEFEKFYNRVRNQIDELVKTDPNAFYSYDEYNEAAETLYKLVKLRGESIEKQLSGTIPSTQELQNNSSALVDASSLDLSVLGGMNNGNKGGKNFMNTNVSKDENSSSAFENNNASSSDASTPSKEASTENPPQAQNGSEVTAGQNGSPPASMPNGEQPSGAFPGGSPPDINKGASDSGNESSAQKTQSETSSAQSENTESSDSSSAESETSETQNSQSNTNPFRERPDNNFPGMGQGGFPGNGQNNTSSLNFKNLAVYGICFLVMILFLAFALLYKRRPGKG